MRNRVRFSTICGAEVRFASLTSAPESYHSFRKHFQPPHVISHEQALKMSFYDEIEIEDMTYHESTTLYTYPCPCGDQFEISLDELRDGEEVAVCPSCSLQIKVIFEMV